MCGYKIHKLANHIEGVAHDTGIARTVGGGLGVAGGLMGLAAVGSGSALVAVGVLSAPFTAGTSLALAVGGMAVVTAAGVTSVAAGAVKDRNLHEDIEAISKLVDDLNWMDEIMTTEFTKWKVSMDILYQDTLTSRFKTSNIHNFDNLMLYILF